jgi:AcrR family transcriptional regulator
MAPITAEKVQATKKGLLEAASTVLRTDGYAGISTRAVAAIAGVPMSQIQYHFGSKQGLLLALFEHQNALLLERQQQMFSDPALTLSAQWKLACDYLDEDLASGYVRVLNELVAAGWSNPVIGDAVREAIAGWVALLSDVARRSCAKLGGFGPFEPEDVAALVGSAFMGAELNIISGHENPKMPVRRALRRIGDIIEKIERAEAGGN